MPKIVLNGPKIAVSDHIAERSTILLTSAFDDLVSGMKEKPETIFVSWSTTKPPLGASVKGDPDQEPASANYVPIKPITTMDRLVYAAEVKQDILRAVARIAEQRKIYEEWGLNTIEPNPKSAINLFGPPGTGKTAAAHAMAASLGKPIISASYADIESKYHGEGPKNVQAIFRAAVEHDAVLFIDEADSLLSKRLSSVTQGSEQAINSMRSQLLINMETHRGLIVFATNFASNYDPAFDSRLVHVNIPLPDYEQRLDILKLHLPQKLPRHPDFSHEEVAAVENVCGRDIKNAVLAAAVDALSSNPQLVTSSAIRNHLQKSVDVRKDLRDSGDIATRIKAALVKRDAEGFPPT